MFILDKQDSVGSVFINEIRDKDVQQDRMRFRKNLERIGFLLAYEISKSFSFKAKHIQTPLASHNTVEVSNNVILATILRAGLPFYHGFLTAFDQADSAFVGAYRIENDLTDKQLNDNPEIDLNYIATEGLEGKTLILIDPMLASGNSLVKAYNKLLDYGKPGTVHVAAAIASQTGLNNISKQIPEASLWLGSVDPTLNDKAYIVPGLGDAGDLAFGKKIS